MILHDLALSLVGSGLGPALFAHLLVCLEWLAARLDLR